ncbi:MAG: hypothetical protein ACK4KW_01830 [Gemmobacter sp.]
MSGRFGPDRRELRLRLWISLGGLALLLALMVTTPVAGLAWIEVVGFAGLFFGLSAIHSARRLLKGHR